MTAMAAFVWALALSAPVEYAVPEMKGRGPLSVAEQDAERAQVQDPVAVWNDLARAFQVRGQAQVRIEQRVIMRIVPRPGPSRESLTALAPVSVPQTRMQERPMDDCVSLSSIAGVQPRGQSRLLLFLRDRRLVAADLERSCSARDFYSGFYVEKSSDGRLCTGRDKVLARSGARCSLSGFSEIVPADG